MNTEGERIALEKTHVERDSAHLEVRNFFPPFFLSKHVTYLERVFWYWQYLGVWCVSTALQMHPRSAQTIITHVFTKFGVERICCWCYCCVSRVFDQSACLTSSAYFVLIVSWYVVRNDIAALQLHP